MQGLCWRQAESPGSEKIRAKIRTDPWIRGRGPRGGNRQEAIRKRQSAKDSPQVVIDCEIFAWNAIILWLSNGDIFALRSQSTLTLLWLSNSDISALRNSSSLKLLLLSNGDIFALRNCSTLKLLLLRNRKATTIDHQPKF